MKNQAATQNRGSGNPAWVAGKTVAVYFLYYCTYRFFPVGGGGGNLDSICVTGLSSFPIS